MIGIILECAFNVNTIVYFLSGFLNWFSIAPYNDLMYENAWVLNKGGEGPIKMRS